KSSSSMSCSGTSPSAFTKLEHQQRAGLPNRRFFTSNLVDPVGTPWASSPQPAVTAMYCAPYCNCQIGDTPHQSFSPRRIRLAVSQGPHAERVVLQQL